MFFDEVSEAPSDPVFGKIGVFNADPRKDKVNLMVGIYVDEFLKKRMFPSVIAAKDRASKNDQIADYLPFHGNSEFVGLIGTLLFGEELWKANQTKIYGAQALGGTGAVCLGAKFLVQEVSKMAAILQPTWPNHRNILERAGCSVVDLPYYSTQLHRFDSKNYFQALRALAPKTAVLFHASCHNPTGSDPTREEWRQIAHIMKEKNLVPFFDCAYQGIGDGMAEDAEAIRFFLKEEMEMVIAYSCSKNFSLYCQRVGAIFVVTKDEKSKHHVGSQMQRIIRGVYSNPPAHGAQIVVEVMRDPVLIRQWENEVNQARERLCNNREIFLRELIERSKTVDFRFAKHHKGMFSYLDLNEKQVERLKEKHAVYTLGGGRINLAGLNQENISKVVEAIVEVCNH